MRIGLTGTISCGKTTLVNELSKLPEFKDYSIFTERSKELRDFGVPLNTDSTLEGQTIFMAERFKELYKENMLTDRSIWDVMAFTSVAKSITVANKLLLNDISCQYCKKYDLVVYVDPEGVDIEDNGVRTTDAHYRMKLDAVIKSLIVMYPPTKLIRVSGPTSDRIQSIMKTFNIYTKSIV